MDKNYFNVLNQISTELSRFKSNNIGNDYGIHVNNRILSKLENYNPLPSNRQKRSRLYVIKKSNCLFRNNDESENNRGVKSLVVKKTQVKQLLNNKGLI